eukprot:1157263-Pelagomonas_calceolata.AAC.4
MLQNIALKVGAVDVAQPEKTSGKMQQAESEVPYLLLVQQLALTADVSSVALGCHIFPVRCQQADGTMECGFYNWKVEDWTNLDRQVGLS